MGVAVSGSRDARVKIWCLTDGKCMKTFDYSSPVLQVGSHYLLSLTSHFHYKKGDHIYLFLIGVIFLWRKFSYEGV